MADPNIGQIAASVWDKKIGKQPTDNIFKSRALFYFLGANGFKEEAAGGKTFEFPLEYAENQSNKSYSELEELDTTRYDVFDAAQFSPKIIAGTVVYSELERLRAMGDSAKFDVLAAKMENGKNSHIAALNRQMHSDGSGNASKDIAGLTHIIASTPTSGTVGGINRATFTFWRNQQNAGTQTSSDFDNLRSAMRTTYNQCSSGGTEFAPTSWITTRTVFEGYESLLVANERYNKDGKTRGGDLGFANDALMFKGAEGYYDEEATASELRFLNPQFIKLVYYKGGWMKMYPEVDPANLLANVHKLATFANMGCSNPRRLGVVTAIS